MEIKKKRGAQPLERYDDRIDVISKKMKLMNIPMADLKKNLPFNISYSGLSFKLRKITGCHDFEIMAIEKVIAKIEKKIISSLG